MAETNDRNWLANYAELKEFVGREGHLPPKHTKLLNWVKYQRKRAKLGSLSNEELRKLEMLNIIRTNG